MRVLVTGGCGYTGSVLVPKLLDRGHEVEVLDLEWFGNTLGPDVRVIHADLRDLGAYKAELPRFEAVIHLAAIANDPCGELDSKLTWEVNALGTMRLADACVRAQVGQIIFASSASIYGLKDNRPVIEEDEPEPVSDYNRTKMVAERCLWSYIEEIQIQIVRPATLCGASPRMRLDTMVNMLTAQALESGKIKAHCGEHGARLMRPNTHVDDITDLYVWLLDDGESNIWNAGFENITALETAEMIREVVPAEIEITTVKDKRSYAVDSRKLLDFGFRPRKTVSDAIREMAEAWKAGKIRRDERSVNLEWMRRLGVAG